MDVEVAPLFRSSLRASLETHLLGRLYDVLLGDGFFDFILEIALRQDEHDGLRSLNILNLDLPSIHVLKRFFVVASYANHEAVRTPVLHFAVDAEVLITTRIVNLDLELVLVDGLDATIHVQYGRLIVFRERIVEVVSDETRLTDRCVSNKH